MNKVMKEIIKYDTDSGTMIASSSGDTAIIFTVDNERTFPYEKIHFFSFYR